MSRLKIRSEGKGPLAVAIHLQVVKDLLASRASLSSSEGRRGEVALPLEIFLMSLKRCSVVSRVRDSNKLR